MPIPVSKANMAAQNPGGSGHSSRGAYSGRNRHRPQPNRNNRNGFPEDYSTPTNLDGHYSQDVGAVASNADSLTSSIAPKEKPRRGRGFAGPPRNVYRRQPSNHQFVEANQRQGYTTRNDSINYMQDHPTNQNRSHYSQNSGQPMQDVSLGETRSRNSQPRASQIRDPEANFQQYPQPINHFSNYVQDGNQGYNRGANQFAENSSEFNNYPARGAAARPKQNRGPKRQKPKPEYKQTYGQAELFVGATALTFENSSYQQNYPSSDVAPPMATLEHQPFENIRREYAQYRSRPTFTEAQYDARGGKRTSQDVRYRRDDKSGGGHSSQERFHRDESSGSFGSRDRFRVEEQPSRPVPAATTRDQQPSFNKPSRSYDSQNWRSEGFKKGFSSQKQKVEADTATQRERLTTQLTSGTYECMVCCESVKPAQVKQCSFHSELGEVINNFNSILFSQFGIAVNVFTLSISVACGVGPVLHKTVIHFSFIII